MERARAPRRNHLASASIVIALVLGVAACGDDEDIPASSEGSTTTAEPTDTTGGEDVDETSTSGPAPRTGQADAAVADLAARLDVEPTEVVVVSVEAVTWRDSSLGCPQEGFMYQQVLTEGVRIVLEVDGTTYEYHGGGTGDPIYCTNPQDPYSVG